MKRRKTQPAGRPGRGARRPTANAGAPSGGAERRKPQRLLVIRNRQRTRAIDTRQLQTILRSVLTDDLGVHGYELCVHLVGAAEMTGVNETFLRHAGSTDVITFNHAAEPDTDRLHGEIFVCVDEAVALAPRFRTDWPAEVVRYAVHGCLHLQGHDDQEPGARARMKRHENRALAALRRRFVLAQIARTKRAGH